MPIITTDQLQGISVKTVEMFLNDKVPLSEGLAKQASAMGLNSEQIQRAVEATNSIAYLKVLQVAEDRTMEFPLCKYAEVIEKIAVPDMQKVATLLVNKTSAVGASSMEKTAHLQITQLGRTPGKSTSELSAQVMEKIALSDQEQFVYFIKAASANEQRLSELKDRKVTLHYDLVKTAGVLRNDPLGLEKLARVTDDAEFSRLSALVTGKVLSRADTGIFKSAELKDAQRLSHLYKEAAELVKEVEHCEKLAERCYQIKQAGIMSGLGYGIGRAISGVAAAPFKMAAKGLSKLTTATGSNLKNTANNLNATLTNKARAAMGKPTIAPINKSKRYGLTAAAGALGVAGFDAAMYAPGTHKDTGTSKDAWTALQRQ